MPGIFGFIRKTISNLKENEILLKKMSQSLAYKKWYTEELFWDEVVGIGRRGLTPFYKQPIYSQDKSLIMFID